MDHDRFLALLSFIRDNEAGIQQVKLYDNALMVVVGLADEGMGAYALLRRCCHPHFGERLIAEVSGLFEGKKQRAQFISALVRMDQGWWEENSLNPHRVLEMLRGHDILDCLLSQHSELVTHPEHPLYCEGGSVVADDYWKPRVRRFITRGDFRRAWDELQKAERGVVKATIHAEHYDDTPEFMVACADRANRCWCASSTCIGALAMELYRAMRNKGVLTEIGDEDRITDPWGRAPQTVYETKAPRSHRHKPREYSQRFRRPGHSLALNFVEAEIEGSSWPKKYRLKEAGAAILKIAAHFREKRNERRRAKHAAALAEYERALEE